MNCAGVDQAEPSAESLDTSHTLSIFHLAAFFGLRWRESESGQINFHSFVNWTPVPDPYQFSR